MAARAACRRSSRIDCVIPGRDRLHHDVNVGAAAFGIEPGEHFGRRRDRGAGGVERDELISVRDLGEQLSRLGDLGWVLVVHQVAPAVLTTEGDEPRLKAFPLVIRLTDGRSEPCRGG